MEKYIYTMNTNGHQKTICKNWDFTCEACLPVNKGLATKKRKEVMKDTKFQFENICEWWLKSWQKNVLWNPLLTNQ